MSLPRHMRRNNVAFFAIRAVESITFILPLLFVWFSVRTRWPLLFGMVPADLLFGLLGAVAVAAVVVEWWTTRFAVDHAGLSYEKGLLFKRSTSLSWPDVASVHASRSPAARLLGCVKLVIGIGADSKASVVMEAIPVGAATRIQEYFTADLAGRGTDGRIPSPKASKAGPEATTSGAEVDAPASSAGRRIYRIRVRDYLMLSITYGQFLLIIPFVVGLYENASQFLALPSLLDGLSFEGAQLTVFAVVSVVVGVPMAVGFGMLLAWMRYRSFEVRLRDGVFTMSGGLVSAESRHVSQSQVAGLKIMQNPLMRLAGYARLGFVSQQAGEKLGANTIFPTVRLPYLRDGITTHFPAYSAVVDRPCAPSRRYAAMLIGSTAGALLLGGLATAHLPTVAAICTMSALACTLLVATNYCWAATACNPTDGVVVFRRGFLWVTHYVVSAEAVYFAESYQLFPRRGASAEVLCFGIYDARALRLWAPAIDKTTLDHFIQAAAGTSHGRRSRRRGR